MRLRIKQDQRGISNVIVVMLSLVILVTIVANVVLWSYQMNQLDWERMQEKVEIVDVARVTSSSWFVAQNEYTVNIGSHVSGTYTDTQAIDDQYERFTEPLPLTYYPNGYNIQSRNWWDQSYGYRKKITITNNAGSTLSSGYPVWVTMDTASLVTAGKMRLDGNDLRIVYWNSTGSSWLELNRDVVDMNSSATEVWFKTQAPIGASSSDSNYYVYYGYSSAVSPPSNKSEVYLYWADFEDGTQGWTTSGYNYNWERDSEENLVGFPLPGSWNNLGWEPTEAHGGVYLWGTGIGAPYPDDNNQYGYLNSPAIDLTNAQGDVTLRYWLAYNVEGAGYDSFRVEIDDNSGFTSPTAIEIVGETGGYIYDIQQNWYEDTYDVTSCKGGYLYMRVGFESDGGWRFGGVYVDDVNIRQSVSPEPSTSVGPEELSCYVSGTVPESVQAVDSDYLIIRSVGSATSSSAYNPSSYNLIESTTHVSGSVSNLTNNDGIYMTFRSPDSWLNYCWQYRRPITIDNTQNSNNLTHYQVKVIVDTASLISDGKMQPDGSDIRFTSVLLDEIYELPVIINNTQNSNNLTSYPVKLTITDSTILDHITSDGRDIRLLYNQQADPYGVANEIPLWIELRTSSELALWAGVNVTAGSTRTIYMYYGNSSVSSVSDCSFFDFCEDWESGTIDTTIWTRDGSVSPYWIIHTVAYQGNYSSGNNDIGDNQYSSIQTNITLSAPSKLIFYWKVSSEANYDYLRFYINGTEQIKISGDVGWQQQTYDLGAGNCIVKWSYTKDGSVSTGADTGWIDSIIVRKYSNPDPTTSMASETLKYTIERKGPIPYWIEHGINTTNTIIWVKVPSIQGSSNETIHMYYGNPDASATSTINALDATYTKANVGYEWIPRVSTTDVANGDDVGSWQDLPFDLPYWRDLKNRVYVCSNGFAIFDPTAATNDWSNSLSELKARWKIAPFWDDLRTDQSGGIVSSPGIYVDNYGDHIIVTWETTRYGSSSDSIKFQIILSRNGDIRINMDNATNFANFSPTLGISKGDNINYIDITAEKGTTKSWLFLPRKYADPEPTTSVGSEEAFGVEFTGSSNNYAWTQLVWTIDSAWSVANVEVRIQLWNHALGKYSTSGDGYLTYTSSAIANTDETKTQTISTNPTDFRDDSGNWKIRITCRCESASTPFDFKCDWVEFKPTYYSEYAVSTEFVFSGMTTEIPTQLNFTIVSEYDIEGVNVLIQVWNYSSSAYVTTGEGYSTYTSTGANVTKILSINTNPQFYTSAGNAKIKITGVKTTTTQYQQKINQIKLDYKMKARLDVDGAFVIDVSTYPIACIQTIEIQLRYRADDAGEKWYLKAYNWTVMNYSDSGFNFTAGHTPTTGWDYYTVNLSDQWGSYVHNNGTVYVKIVDEGADSTQTIIDIDFLAIRVVIDGTKFTFQNEGPLTSHIVSLWIVNSTVHQRYDISVFVNSGETLPYLRVDICLPSGEYVVKVVTERGNIAVYKLS